MRVKKRPQHIADHRLSTGFTSPIATPACLTAAPGRGSHCGLGKIGDLELAKLCESYALGALVEPAVVRDEGGKGRSDLPSDFASSVVSGLTYEKAIVIP